MVGEKPRAERANIAKWNEHVGALVENFPSCRRIFPTVTRQPLPNMKIEIAGNRCLGETKYEGNNVIKICVLSYFILKKKLWYNGSISLDRINLDSIRFYLHARRPVINECLIVARNLHHWYGAINLPAIMRRTYTLTASRNAPTRLHDLRTTVSWFIAERCRYRAMRPDNPHRVWKRGSVSDRGGGRK